VAVLRFLWDWLKATVVYLLVVAGGLTLFLILSRCSATCHTVIGRALAGMASFPHWGGESSGQMLGAC
jgi:hypothetical protein